MLCEIVTIAIVDIEPVKQRRIHYGNNNISSECICAMDILVAGGGIDFLTLKE